jgi:hypothetical protein
VHASPGSSDHLTLSECVEAFVLMHGTCPAFLVARVQAAASELSLVALLRLLVACEHLDLDVHAEATLRLISLLDHPDRLELRPEDCARVVGAAALLPDAPRRHDALVALIRRHAGAMASEDIGRTVLALAKYPAAMSDNLEAIRDLESRLSADEALQPAVLCNLAASCALDTSDRMHERLPTLLTAASHRLARFSASDLELLLYALAHTRSARPVRLVDRCVARLEVFATELLPRSIASVLWSLATLGAAPPASLLTLLSLRLADFLSAARDTLVCLSIHQLSTCVWSFGVLNHRPLNLSAMVEVAARLSDRIGAEDCSRLLWALARLDFGGAELVQARLRLRLFDRAVFVGVCLVLRAAGRGWSRLGVARSSLLSTLDRLNRNRIVVDRVRA